MILERVIAGTRAVVSGQASFERDSVVFKEPDPDPVILATLTRLKPRDRPLRILDFGGSLGSCYYQHRAFITGAVEWLVVEQPHYVAAGQAEFQTAELRFHLTVDSACTAGTPDVVLLSSVLQYLPRPYGILTTLAALPAQGWLVARTPFCKGSEDYVVIQHVPRHIYRASYPAWVFSEVRFTEFWLNHDKTLRWHPTAEGDVPLGDRSFTYRTAEIR